MTHKKNLFAPEQSWLFVSLFLLCSSFSASFPAFQRGKIYTAIVGQPVVGFNTKSPKMCQKLSTECVTFLFLFAFYVFLLENQIVVVTGEFGKNGKAYHREKNSPHPLQLLIFFVQFFLVSNAFIMLRRLSSYQSIHRQFSNVPTHFSPCGFTPLAPLLQANKQICQLIKTNLITFTCTLELQECHSLPRVTSAHTAHNFSSHQRTLWSLEEVSLTPLNSLLSLQFTLRTRYKSIS